MAMHFDSVAVPAQGTPPGMMHNAYMMHSGRMAWRRGYDNTAFINVDATIHIHSKVLSACISTS